MDNLPRDVAINVIRRIITNLDYDAAAKELESIKQVSKKMEETVNSPEINRILTKKTLGELKTLTPTYQFLAEFSKSNQDLPDYDKLVNLINMRCKCKRT